MPQFKYPLRGVGNLIGQAGTGESSLSFCFPKNGEVEENYQQSHLGSEGLRILPDGSGIVHTDNGSNVFYYSMSTPYDLTTIDNSGVSVSASLSGGGNQGVCFSSDGTKMFVADNNNNEIAQYTMSTAYDVTTINSGDGSRGLGYGPKSVAITNDGTKMFAGDGNGNLQELSLTTANDVTTGAQLETQQNFSIENNSLSTITIHPTISDFLLVYEEGVGLWLLDTGGGYDLLTASRRTGYYVLSSANANLLDGFDFVENGNDGFFYVGIDQNSENFILFID